MSSLLDAVRFAYFSRASLDYLVKLGKHPDVIHIHNWETAIIGPLFWDIFANQVWIRNTTAPFFNFIYGYYCRIMDTFCGTYLQPDCSTSHPSILVWSQLSLLLGTLTLVVSLCKRRKFTSFIYVSNWKFLLLASWQLLW